MVLSPCDAATTSTSPSPSRSPANTEVAFEADDLLAVRPGAGVGQGWWLASLDDRRGLVPRHVLDPDWRPRAALACSALRRAFAAHAGRIDAAEQMHLRAASYIAACHRGNKVRAARSTAAAQVLKNGHR